MTTGHIVAMARIWAQNREVMKGLSATDGRRYTIACAAFSECADRLAEAVAEYDRANKVAKAHGVEAPLTGDILRRLGRFVMSKALLDGVEEGQLFQFRVDGGVVRQFKVDKIIGDDVWFEPVEN